MKQLVIPDVEQLKGQLYLFRTVTAILNGINVFIGNVQAGEATLVSGTVKVNFPGLTPASRIIAGYARTSGTPGFLSVDPQLYDLPKRVFTINSSSSADTGLVTWQLLN